MSKTKSAQRKPTLTEAQIESLHRAAETLRDNARTSLWSSLDATDSYGADIFRGAAETYAREANAVAAAMRVLGLSGVASDITDEDFEKMAASRKQRRALQSSSDVTTNSIEAKWS